MESGMERIYQKLPIFNLQEVITSLGVFFNKSQRGKAKTKSYKSFYSILPQTFGGDVHPIRASFFRITPAQQWTDDQYCKSIIKEGENDRETMASSL